VRELFPPTHFRVLYAYYIWISFLSLVVVATVIMMLIRRFGFTN